MKYFHFKLEKQDEHFPLFFSIPGKNLQFDLVNIG